MSASAITRDTFFTLPIESLKKTLITSQDRDHLFSIFDNAWIKSQALGTLVTFISRIFVVCSWNGSSTTPSDFLRKIVIFKQITEDECASFTLQVLEETFENTRPHFMAVVIGLYRQLCCDPGLLDNLSHEEEFHLIREVASKHYSSKILAAYPYSLPLDAKLPHH